MVIFRSVSGRAFCRWMAFAAGLAGLALVSRADSLQTDQFVGAVGCKSSSCHGGAGEKRSQYLTWVQQDFHSRAYAVLTTARSARMAESLAPPTPAQTNPRCTVCHSPFQSVAPARLASTAKVDEGISCESCHGAASAWLRGHTRTDWSYATRVGAGMRDLRNFYVRANACVACHQNLEPDLLAAGHPELTFELDGQSVAEPKHWRDEPGGGPRTWLVGQAVALREMSWQLAKSEKPEAEATTRWSALAWLLAKATANQPRLPAINLPDGTVNQSLFTLTQAQADRLARQASDVSWDNERTRALRRALLATRPEFGTSPTTPVELLFLQAERLTLALDRLSRAPEQAAAPPSPAIATLFEDIRVRPEFKPAKFATDLARLSTTMEPAP